jgi:[ribosomal protein S18]-alanine N-acetyltransferase
MSDRAASHSVRPMAESDLDSVLALAASLPEAPHWPRPVYLDAVKSAALNPESTSRRIALVAVESREIAGFAVASLVPPQAELESIAVAAASQRLGLGRLLFSALSAELRQAGVTEVSLEVRASNRPALGFYQSLGFQQTGLRQGYYADPIEDAVLLTLALG